MKKVFIMTAFAMLATAAMSQTPLKSGIDLSDMNQTVKPGDNFYEYACGGWMKKHPLPAAYSRYGSFDRLAEDNNKRINSILDELQKGNYAKGTVEQKLSDYYKLAMDSTRRNKEGVKPAMTLIKEIEAAPTVEALRAIQDKYAALGIGVPMGIGFGADEKNASQNILNVYQGGLTLGQKEYYLDSDKPTTEIREAYKKHIVRMFQLFGFKKKEAQKKMELILDYETQLAQVSKSRTELRDVEANYNKVTLEVFKAIYPNIPLEKFLNAEGVATKYFQEMIIGQPDFLAGADKLIGTHSADQLRAYMEWDVITGSASYLSDDVVEANFDFFGKTMSGRKENFPRWKRATNQVEAQMGKLSPMALVTQIQVLMFLMNHMGEFDPSSTFDQYFQAQAQKNNMPCGGLETVAFQSQVLYKGQPLERQIEQLMCLIDNEQFNSQMMEDMTKAFYAEDLDALKKAMDAKLGTSCDSTPEEEAALIYNRNADWLTKMPAIMKAAPTFFAVGAGHLPGEKGVLQLLKNAGYTVEGVK